MKSFDKVRNAFNSIIQRLLNHWVIDEIVYDLERDPDNKIVNPHGGFTVILLLSGQQTNRFFENGQLTTVIHKPNQMLFMDSFCPNLLTWEFPCQRLGIGCKLNTLSMSWNNHVPPNDTQTQKLWFYCEAPLHEEIRHVGNAIRDKSSIQQRTKHINSELCKLLLLMIQNQLVRCRETPVKMKSQNTFKSINEFIINNLHQPLNRKTVADFFNLSPDYLTRLFQQQGGVVFSDYLARLRLDKAVQLLHCNTYNINDVASQCGFSGANYFIKVFQKEHGVTPGEYRKTIDQKSS